MRGDTKLVTSCIWVHSAHSNIFDRIRWPFCESSFAFQASDIFYMIVFPADMQKLFKACFWFIHHPHRTLSIFVELSIEWWNTCQA